MSHAISVDTALSLDTTPVKWPFAPQAPGSRQGERAGARRPAAAVRAVRTPVGTPAAPCDSLGSFDVEARADRADPVEARSIHSMSMAALAQHAKVGRRQMIMDVGLVLMWAGLIPAVLWLGHAAGY